jgi:hypothetical protein
LRVSDRKKEEFKLEKDLTVERSIIVPNHEVNESNNNCSIIQVELQEKSTLISSRRDYRGCPIIKGKKKHKISFVDELKSCEIYDIIIVECFKAYNVVSSKETTNTNCRCNII